MKVYELSQYNVKEAWLQLSDEERKSYSEKIVKVREDGGGERLALFSTNSSKWRGVRLLVFPDIEAYDKFQMMEKEMNARKYFEWDITLGFEQSE